MWSSEGVNLILATQMWGTEIHNSAMIVCLGMLVILQNPGSTISRGIRPPSSEIFYPFIIYRRAYSWIPQKEGFKRDKNFSEEGAPWDPWKGGSQLLLDYRHVVEKRVKVLWFFRYVVKKGMNFRCLFVASTKFNKRSTIWNACLDFSHLYLFSKRPLARISEMLQII